MKVSISSKFILRAQPPFFYRIIDKKTGKEWPISKELYHFILKHNGKSLPEGWEGNVIGKLINKGVLCKSKETEKQDYKILKPYNIVFPLELAVIHFTNKCNLNCLHCYFKDIKTEEKLSFNELKVVIKQLVKMNVYKFLITGGEPLVRREILKLCRLLTKYNVLFSINTNGTLLTEKMLNNLYESGLRRIKISLDGITPEAHDTLRNQKGVWKQVMKNLKVVKRFKEDGKLYWVSISSMLTKLNKDEIFKLFDFLVNDLKPDEWILERPLFSGSAKLHWNRISLSQNESFKIINALLTKIEKLQPKYPSRIYLDTFYDWYNPKETANCYKFLSLPQFCREHSNYLFIDANGDIVLCPCMPLDDEILGKIGNVREEAIASLWKRVVQKRQFYAKKLKKCLKCKYLSICGSGCRVRALKTTGSSLGCDLLLRRWLHLHEKGK